jgi:hypothetical protein
MSLRARPHEFVGQWDGDTRLWLSPDDNEAFQIRSGPVIPLSPGSFRFRVSGYCPGRQVLNDTREAVFIQAKVLPAVSR